ncbi:SDR family NAD(P)-dependent oxidoreductase [Thalassobaculum sp.]|uniref:SDR family NAD(P)-dependent oxidoreductase n=1 Tax=Thalassobaculum sp. TaxID=2022740 RepID=UPI003B58EEE3
MAERVALVTAGAQGIGRAVVLALSAAGWNVTAIDIDAEALAELPDTILTVAGDVGDEAVVADAIARTVDRFGRLDAIVNNAGINANGPVESLDLDAVRTVLDVSLVSILATAKHGAAHLRAAGGGAIVNIASSRALMSEPDTEAYSAAKGGVVAVTHALAMSLGTREDRNTPPIRVSAISPGWIETGPWQKASKRRDPEHSDADREQHPAGRVGRPEDIAEAVLYLLDDRAGFITGQNLVIDGGMTKKMIYVE